jgi:hypothetical protein
VETFAVSLGATSLRAHGLPWGRCRPSALSTSHDVVNRGRQGLTIQAYSPRMTSMTFYELVPGVGLRVLHSEAPAHRDPAEPGLRLATQP